MLIAENSTKLPFQLMITILRVPLVKAVPRELLTRSGKASKVSLDKNQHSTSKTYKFYPGSISECSLNYFGAAFGVVTSN